MANKPALWLWFVAIATLVRNLIGVTAYLKQAFITDDQLA